MNSFPFSKVRWGILGVGDVCEVKSAPAMQKIADSELVAVMRRTTNLAKDYANRHGVPKWYDKADDLIQDPDVNAIYIATPPHAHAELTRKAAAAGKPVYVEKPMARTYRECTEMIKACSRAKVPLFVAYYRRALSNFLKIKSLVESGAIGDIRTLHIQMYQSPAADMVADTSDNWRVQPEIAGGGYFYDLASHQLDFLDFLLGSISKASGFSGNQAGWYEANDAVTASFRFENGVLGTGSWCFTADKSSVCDQTTIIGSKGQIVYPTFDGSFVNLKREQEEEQIFEFEMPEHIQQPLIRTMVGELVGNGRCPSTGKTGARTNKVMEMITQPDLD